MVEDSGLRAGPTLISFDPETVRRPRDVKRAQRPLWASTGVKNPDYSDTLYVTELIAPRTVKTMPEKTIDAVADHGVITADSVTGTSEAAQSVFDALDAVGIDVRDVFLMLENDGVEKFKKSWEELLAATQNQLDAAMVD